MQFEIRYQNIDDVKIIEQDMRVLCKDPEKIQFLEGALWIFNVYFSFEPSANMIDEHDYRWMLELIYNKLDLHIC